MPEKFIGNMKPLQQFMEDGPFLVPEIPVVFRALQALSAPEYIDYLCFLGCRKRLDSVYSHIPPTPAAMRDEPPSRTHSASKDTIEIAFDRTGVKYAVKAVKDVGISTAKKEKKAPLTKGQPVLVKAPCDVTVLGHQDNGLYGVWIFANPDERAPPHGYNCVADWRKTIKAYVLIDEYVP